METEAVWRQAEFEEARDRAQAGLDQINDMLAEREARGAPASSWEPPQPTPAPVRRQPQPQPTRSPAPPWPTKLSRTVHDPATGRVVAVESYEGIAVQQVSSWESWVHATIKAALDRRLYDEIWKQLHVFAKAWGEDEAKDWHAAHDRFAEIERRLERVAALEARLQQLETRAAAPPRLVQEAPDAAAD